MDVPAGYRRLDDYRTVDPDAVERDFLAANAGLPATSGFIGEFMVVLGAIQFNRKADGSLELLPANEWRESLLELSFDSIHRSS